MQKHDEWIKKAYSDLIGAKMLFENDTTLDLAIYHTQQCAEKALKSYLVYKKQEIRKVHDLVQLLKDCFEFEPDFWKFITTAKLLKPFATKFRYPDDLLLPDRSDVAIAIQKAEDLFNFVKSKM